MKVSGNRPAMQGVAMSSIRRGLAAFVFSVLALSPALAQNKIVFGTVGSGSPLEWPLYIATKKGFLEQEKVALDWVGVSSSAGVMQQIAAGSLNMGTSGIADALRAPDRGAPTRLLRVSMKVSPYEIFAAKTVKSWTDLRKKTVMIGGAKDITRVYFEDMAKANGLAPGEYDYVFAGSTAARFSALTSGSIAATILFPPFNFAAARAGYTSLGLSADYTKTFPFTAYSVNVNWARSNKDAVRSFLAAYTKGVDWFYDSANRAEAIPILISYLKSDPKDAADTYDFFVKLRGFDRTGAVEGSGIENYLAILKQQGDLEGGTDLGRFYDPTLIR
jgi:ABC-type nitrate/sulfonate/bicarbonate transport system substrate-binding protein